MAAQRGRIDLRVMLGAFALLLSCSSASTPSPGEPQSTRVEREKSPKSEKPADKSCEGAPLPVGQVPKRPGLSLPGPIRALVARGSRLWACGDDGHRKGYVAKIRLDGEGQALLLESRELPAPCRGLNLRGEDLALWLQGWQALWIPKGARRLDSPAAPLRRIEAKKLSSFDPQWPIRAQWVESEQAYYLAAGGAGLLRLGLEQDRFASQASRVAPTIYARDLLLWDSALLVADPQRGLVAWSPSKSRELGAWHDAGRAGPSGMQRLALSQDQVAIAAGPAGAYVVQAIQDKERILFELHKSYPAIAPVHDVSWSSQGPWWLSADRYWPATGGLQRRFPSIQKRGVMHAITAASGSRFWLAQGRRVELFTQSSVEGRATLLPLASFAAVDTHFAGELPFRVQGQGELWLQRPQLRGDRRLALELENWPPPHEDCPDLYRFRPGERFALRLRIPEGSEGLQSSQLRVASSDPQFGEMIFDILAEPPATPDLIERELPPLGLARWSDGVVGPSWGAGQWQWLEFVRALDLGSEDFRERLSALQKLAQAERRNGSYRLKLALIVGGPIQHFQFERVAQMQGWGKGVEIYFDPLYSAHRSFTRTKNGRYYPLRVLVDPLGKIRYIDQKPGMASAVGRYRELSLE